VFVFVRPERYTYEFMERKGISEEITMSSDTLISKTSDTLISKTSDMFTLSFFDEKYREALNICGSKSGRNCDKVAETGLKPCFTKFDNPTFKEARLVIECRKLYAEMFSEDAFIDKGIFNTHYFKKGGLHKMYIAEIINVWEK
jgi:flavin reductase (DIM6/NTAB) family NADH-FMN oxidoreductase RutF